MRKIEIILSNATKSIPFYIENCRKSKSINDFPIIDKNVIKNDYYSFLDDRIVKDLLKKDIFNIKNYGYIEQEYNSKIGKIIVEHTSGTSGMPFSVIKLKQERVMLGLELWKTRNKFHESTPHDLLDFLHKDPFENVKFLDDKSLISQEILFLSKNNIHSWWQLNSKILNDYSRKINELKLSIPNLEIIENNGSYLSKYEKDIYSKIFNCKIADNYGCKEVWTIAYSCSRGNMHIVDNIFFELIDDNDKIIIDSNIEGNVVVTSLIQRAMPFIRYKTGDRAKYVDKKCYCGNTNRIIEIVPNRTNIYNTSISGERCFKDILIRLMCDKNIKGFDSITVVQTNPSTFNVNISKNKEKRDIIEKAFIDVADEYLQNKYNYLFTYNNNNNMKGIFCVKLNEK